MGRILEISGIPFFRINGNVEDECPMGESQWSKTVAETEALLGMSKADYTVKCFGTTSNPTLYDVYNTVGANVAKLLGEHGEIILDGAYTQHTSGTYFTDHGWTLSIKVNGVMTPALHGTTTGPTCIYYPVESNTSPSQWVVVGLVDANNHISFATMYGSWGDSYGLYPSANNPHLVSDVNLNFPTVGIGPEDIYGAFENDNWIDPSPDPPAPGPSEGGFDLTNRYSPLLAADNIGLYPLEETLVRKMNKNLWASNFIQSITQYLGLSKDPSDMVLSLKYFYGIAGDVTFENNEAYITLGAYPMTAANATYEVKTLPLTKEFCTHDCGTVTIPATNSDYTDYLTEYQIYVPFYGYMRLEPKDIVGGTLSLKYNISLLTGDAIFYITANNSHSQGIVIAQGQCNVAVEIPTLHESMKDLQARIAAAAGAALGAGIVTGSGIGAVAAAASAITSDPPTSRGSGLSLGVGYLGNLEPFVLVSRKQKVNPSTSANAIGRKDGGVSAIGSHTGFVKVKGLTEASMNALNGCKCKDRIIQALKEGVYV